MLRRILIILIVLAIIAGVAYLVWSFGLRTEQPIEEPPIGGSLPVEETPGGNGKPVRSLSVVSSERVFDFWLNRETGDTWYFTEDGRIFAVDKDGTETSISAQPVKNVRDLSASPDGSLAVVSYGTPERLLFAIYDAEAANWLKPLPQGTAAAAWSPLKNELAYLKDEGASATLTIADFEGDTEREAARLSVKGSDLLWVASDTLYVSNRPSFSIPGSLWSFDLSDRTLKPVIKDEPGLMTAWTADGKIGLKFTTKENGESALTIVSDKNEPAARASIGLTLPSKCALAAEKIYCAVPKNLPAEARLPDDYLKHAFYTDDVFVAIDPANWTAETVFEPSRLTIDAEKIAVYGDALYFVNRYDGLLYKLTLGEQQTAN